MTEKGFGNTLHKRPTMETPVHIEFQGMEPQEKLHAAIARHVAQLEKRFGRITACRVALKGPGQHRWTGGLFEVHIRLALPDEKEVNVGHKPDADERHTDVNFAINDAFKRARRRLQDQVRRLQGHVKTHEPRAEAVWPTAESAADKTSN
jgi:ribosome-associated translation inhibitor RaiA